MDFTERWLAGSTGRLERKIDSGPLAFASVEASAFALSIFAPGEFAEPFRLDPFRENQQEARFV